jgi:hypothetical protein
MKRSLTLLILALAFVANGFAQYRPQQKSTPPAPRVQAPKAQTTRPAPAPRVQTQTPRTQAPARQPSVEKNTTRSNIKRPEKQDRAQREEQNRIAHSNRNELNRNRREARNNDKRAQKDRERTDKRYNKGRRNAARHWDGRRFDHRYFARNFGIYHPFFFGGPGFYWYGNPCLFGSAFEFGDVYFSLNYPCTAMWEGYPWAGVYIDEGPDGYVLINPAYPGVTFGVNIVF